MNIISRETLESLMSQKPEPCVSLYMPTHRTGQEVRQDPIRFKNLLRKAEANLRDYRIKDKEVHELLGPAYDLVDDYFFWNHQSDGLALFLSSENFIYYRLPYQFDELCVVAPSFHLKPLLPLLSNNGQYFVLALDLNNLKLYQASRFSMSEVKLKGIPESLDEALKYDEFQKQIQFHTETPRVANRPPGMFHGQGVGTDESLHKKNILRYFQMVDKGVSRYLSGQLLPLLPAGIDYLISLYKKANSYPNLIEAAVCKDPQSLTMEELQQAAWETIAPTFKQEWFEALEKYRSTLGTGFGSNKIEEIVPAAYDGRVAFLFVDSTRQQWGMFDSADYQVKLNDREAGKRIDLYDFAAVHTILHNGTVYAVEKGDLPEEDLNMAAVFRYSY